MFIWKKEKKGTYIVNSGYRVAFYFFHSPYEFQPKVFKQKKMWRLIWSFRASTKVKVFIWKMMHKGLPVKLKLQARISNVDPQCPRFGEEVESVFHCLIQCSQSVQVWKEIDILEHIPKVNSNF
ncbi:hypothetical protein AHAS_AhasUnG0024400 [Arachis hypogaea]